MEQNGKEIVRLENTNDAQNVIRSLRSRISSRRRYQDAIGGAESIKTLNETIFKASHQRNAFETQKSVVDARLDEYSVRSQVVNNNDLFDEFDDSTPGSSSASASAVISGRRQPLSSSNNNLITEKAETGNNNNNKKSDDSDDDDFLHDDDESTDRLELFQGFTAPRSRVSQGKTRANSGNKRDGVSNVTIGGKGVTIKPGQAIRVKPGSRAKRQEEI